MTPIRVRRHVRRHVRVPVKGAVSLYHECELPSFGTNEHGIEFETMSFADVWKKYATNAKRLHLLDNLIDWLVQHEQAGIRVKEIGIYGSFVSETSDPGDIDVVILREPGGDPSKVWSYMVAKQEHGIDSFSVVNYKHYCNSLAHPRERGSKKVVRIAIDRLSETFK